MSHKNVEFGNTESPNVNITHGNPRERRAPQVPEAFGVRSSY